MASIDRAALASYRRSLDRVCSGAGAAATRALAEWLAAHPNASVEECREAAIAIAGAVLESYGDASSSLACNLFDSVMEAEGISVPAAQMYGGVREGAVEGTVRRVVGDLDGSQGSLDAFTQAVGQLVERETRLAASTTVEENVERVAKTKEGRDVRYARVPTVAVPCKWCAMLASRGFVYRSAERAEAASHHHCTCTIVPGIQGKTQVAGYAPDHYADVWRHRERYVSGDQIDAGGGLSEYGGARGALDGRNDPDGIRRNEHAERYYEELRKRDEDAEVARVSQHTGIGLDTVRQAYRHIFIEKHQLERGFDYFDASYDMAQSWQRMSSGVDIQPQDPILIFHEAIESDFMNLMGMTYEEAHAATCLMGYDWNRLNEEWKRSRGLFG